MTQENFLYRWRQIIFNYNNNSDMIRPSMINSDEE